MKCLTVFTRRHKVSVSLLPLISLSTRPHFVYFFCRHFAVKSSSSKQSHQYITIWNCSRIIPLYRVKIHSQVPGRLARRRTILARIVLHQMMHLLNHNIIDQCVIDCRCDDVTAGAMLAVPAAFMPALHGLRISCCHSLSTYPTTLHAGAVISTRYSHCILCYQKSHHLSFL